MATSFPTSLEAAIAQAQVATQSGIAAGYQRLQVEVLIPELKALELALAFLPALEQYGEHLRVLFSDAGAMALAKRDWKTAAGDTLSCQFGSLDVAGSRQTSTMAEVIQESDRAFLVVAPSAVEIGPVEQLCNAAGDRPVVIFTPNLEDVSVIGIGYAARQLRDRFLSTIETVYYLRPLEGCAVLRAYPQQWQLWLETPDAYEFYAENLTKPSGEDIDNWLLQAGRNDVNGQSPKRGLLNQLQQFLRALSQ
jgi:hypothetical protein